MKKYQKEASRVIESIIEKIEKEYGVSPERLIQKGYSIKELQDTETFLDIIAEVNEVICGNHTNRIITENKRFSEIILHLPLKEEDLICITWDILQNDINIIEEKIKEKKYLSDSQQKILSLSNISQSKIIYYVEEASEEELQLLSTSLRKLIIDIKAMQNYLEHIKHNYFSLRDFYFRKARNFTIEDYNIAAQDLKNIGIHGKLLTILTNDMKKKIAPLVPNDSSSLVQKEESRKSVTVPTSLEKKKIEGSQATQNVLEKTKEKEYLQEFNEMFNKKLGETKRPLVLEEQKRLLFLLRYFGYSEKQCASILKESRYSMPALESFPNTDLIGRINFATSLRETFHTEREIKEQLRFLEKQPKEETNLTDEQRIFRNASILKILINKLTEYHISKEEIELICEERRNLKRQERKEQGKLGDWPQEKEMWRQYLEEILKNGYKQLEYQIELDESKKRILEINRDRKKG